MGFHSLTIGRTALGAANYGLQVTGQNLSNVNTDGYSRQRLNQAGAVYGVGYGNNRALGSGVVVTSVKRVASTMAEKQLRQATSGYNHDATMKNCYTNLQSFFNVSLSATSADRTAISDCMTKFWNSLDTLSSNVETLSTAKTTVTEAETLTERFNKLAADLKEYRETVNPEIENSVTQINTYLREIADLNASIVYAESGGVTGVVANDLRDQRGLALRNLSELVDITVTDEKNGSCIVALNGRTMVYHDQVSGMDVVYESKNGFQSAIPVFAKDKYPVRSCGGAMAAQMEIRDNVIPGYQEELDQLAAAFTWEFNRVYSQTRSKEPLTTASSLNGPVDPSVTLDKLTYKASIPAGAFKIDNGNLAIIVHNRNAPDSDKTVNLEIDLDGRLGPNGEPDMILWDPENPDAENSFINRLQKELDKEFSGVFKVEIDNEYKVSITCMSADYGFCFGEDTSGVLAALGMNTFFTGHNASDIGVNQTLKDDPKLMATGKSFKSGDNNGLLAMLACRDTKLDRLGGMNPDEYFQATAGRLGSEASRCTTQYTLATDVLGRMFNQRESICGVNEDEETVNLIMYQRAYQSAAKYISVIDGLYDTLLNM